MSTCSEREIHLNDIGTVFLVTINDCVAGVPTVLDVSSATTLQLIFQSPSGTSTTQTASLYTDGTDGKVTYTSISGDIDEVGTWRLQASVVIGGGTFRSEVKSFRVHDNI